MNDTFEVIAGDVLVRDRRIAAVGAVPPTEGVDRVIEAHGAFLLPGLIQTHIHLCQTLFRGYADDLALLDWSRTRLWPMEAAHTPTSLAAAARQAASELLMSGTTTVLTMETVHDTDSVFAAPTAACGRRSRRASRCRARRPCSRVDDHEQSVMAEHDVKVLHCPGSNLKLGSGLAPIVEMRAKGISVSLGADGAACNNHLDMFEEMRLAAVLQSVRKGPGALTARDALWMATREGARAIGLERDRPQFIASHDPYSTLVYSARGSDVRTTVVDGEVLVDQFRPTRWDPALIAADAMGEAARLAVRAGF